MKKLMTMIATVAMSFGLFAAGTFTNKVDFTSASATNENPYVTGDSLWAYSVTNNGESTEILADEVQVLDHELVLATGAKVLARKFAAAPVAIGENGLFADMVLDLNGEALDEVPDVTGAKIALFALDGTDIEGLPDATNVYVYAAYGTDGGKALFQLKDNGEEFIGSARRIAVKSYENVLATGSRPGFLVFISDDEAAISEDNIAKVDAFYTFDGSKWVAGSGDYLGGLSIAGARSKWTQGTQKSLFVSMDTDPDTFDTLASIDFQGRGKITSITLTDDDPGFPADNATMTIAATDATVTAVEGNGATLSGNVISMPVENVVTATVETAKGNIMITGANATKVAEGKYEFMLADGGTLTVKGWDAAATVDGEPFEFFFGNDSATCALANVNANGGLLKLAADILAAAEGTEFVFRGENEIILDLAGKTLNVPENGGLSNTGKLTIMDSLTGGNIAGDVENVNVLVVSNGVFNGGLVNTYNETDGDGVTTIYGGTFEGTVENFTEEAQDPTAITITAFGGQFATTENEEDDVKAFLPEEGGYEVVGDKDPDPEYWVVQKEVIKTGTVIFICEKTDFEDGQEGTIGDAVEFPAVSAYETETTIGKGWFTDQDCLNPVTGDETIVAGETTYWAKAVDAVAKVGTEKFETAAAALAKVQQLEATEAFPIYVTALAENGLTITDGDNTAKIAKDVVIGINKEQGKELWSVDGDLEYKGTIEGLVFADEITMPEGTTTITLGVNAMVTVNPGTALTASSFTAPDGYMVKVAADEEIVQFSVAEIVATVAANGATAATPFYDVDDAFAEVQALEQDAQHFPITVTACVDDLEVTNPATEETITLAKDAKITITAAGWAFTGDVEGEVTLAPGKSITVPNGSALVVKAPAGYVAKPQATDQTTTWVIVEAAAEIVGVGFYETIRDALTSDEAAGQTVKFLKNLAAADELVLKTTKVKAQTIDFNGKNVAIKQMWFEGQIAGSTITIKNGTNGSYSAMASGQGDAISIPAGVNLTIQDMTCYGLTAVSGGDNAILTVKDCYFSDLYDGEGNTGVPTTKTAYASYCLTLNGAFARADITGNTFCQMVRAGISGGDTATTMFVYDNLFLGRKNCMTPAQKDERYAAMQIAKAAKVYMENNVYSNENFGADLGMVQGAIRVDDANVGAMVFSGNLFADGDFYFWNRRGGDSVTKNVFYGLNEATEGDFLWGNGIKAADISTVVPAYTPGTNPLALPEGVDSIYAWLHGENADKPYVKNNVYYAELPELEAGDVIIVEPTLANDFALADEELALENVTVDDQVKANMFKVIAKPQAVTITVSLQNVNSVTYTGVVQTADFVIADLAKGSMITISDIVADDQYEVSVTCSKDITDNGDGTFTVAADLSSPNATIDFVGTPMLAVAYTIDGDTIVDRYDINNISDAWTMAKDGVHYIKMFGNWAKSTTDNDLAIDAVCRINNDGNYKIQVKAAAGYPVASITRDANDKFDIYTPYATLQAAVDAEANATEMFVTGAKVDLSTLTLTSAKNTFKGHFGDGVYTGITGSFAEGTEPVCDWSCQATATWGAEGKTFAFIAEAKQQTVTFAANGGEGTQAAITYYAGDAIVAPACTFTAPEKGTFNCWSNATTFATYAVGAALPTDVASYELVADWTIESSPWPTPDPEKPEAEAVAEAMTEAGFSPAAAAAIGTKAEYTAFQDYCDAQSIIPSEVGAAKDNAVLTYALGADACNEEITSEDITITAYDQATGKLTVEIEGVTAGETINSAVLAKVLTAKGGAELKALSTDNVNVTGYAPADGEVEVTVTPKAENPAAFFYQIELVK